MSETTDETDTKPPDHERIRSILENIKNAIWQRRPILKEILERHGNQTIFDYAKDFIDVNKNPVLDARKEELISVVEELIGERLGTDVGKGVSRQLRKRPLVSTIDHHGTIDHPFFVNSNIVSMLPNAAYPEPDINYQIVFSFSSVSVNNASAYPRGLEFHGAADGTGEFIRLPILPDRYKMGVVYGMRAFTNDDLLKAEQELLKKQKNGVIDSARAEKIKHIMDTYFGASEVLNASNLSSQITKLNFTMWPQFFHDSKGTMEKVSDLIYLEIETLVTELLQRFHVFKSDSIIYQTLFNPDYQKLILTYFEKISGAFSKEKGWGTYMFWAVENETLHRVAIMPVGNKLVSNDGKYSFEFTPDGISQALASKQIFPSMMLCYLMVSLYYGMKCLGGFSQVHDLTMMKYAWQTVLRAVGLKKEAESVDTVQTKELGGDGMVLAYTHGLDGTLIDSTGIDMMIDTQHDTGFSHFVSLAKKVTLMEIMEHMMPEIYTVLYPSHERNPEFMALTPARIIESNGLKAKIFAHRSYPHSSP